MKQTTLYCHCINIFQNVLKYYIDTITINWDICELHFLCTCNLSIYCACSSHPTIYCSCMRNVTIYWASWTIFKKRCCEVGPWRPHKLRAFLVHCSYIFFMSIRREFSASYSFLSRSLVTPTSLARLFINSEFCQCPFRCSCQLQLFWYLQQTVCFCCISL